MEHLISCLACVDYLKDKMTKSEFERAVGEIALSDNNYTGDNHDPKAFDKFEEESDRSETD